MTGEAAHDDSDRRWVSDALWPASVGVGVTILASLVPFVGLLAPAIGGGVAGRLGTATGRTGPRVGALTGGLVVLLSLPVTILAATVAATVSPVATAGVLGATAIGAAYVVGSGALGGYLADEFLSRSADVEVAGTPSVEPPVERLKRRYVDGEIGDAEFERRLERLIAADASVGQTDDAADRRGAELDRHEETAAVRER
jgi:hypothetical protein